MPIALSLIGQLRTDDRLSRTEARDWLAQAAVWFEGVGDAVLDARVVRDGEEKPVLLLVIHPASPAVEARLGASGKLRVNATTTPAGPGYHAYLCDLFRQMADEFAFPWVADDCADPTGYFHTRDRKKCEDAFLRWLADACTKKPSTPAQPGEGPLTGRGAGAHAVGLPAAHGFTYPAEVLTPLGPRTHAWAAEVASDPAKGRDFFPWWSPVPDAAFYRGRAIVRLWCEYFWRPPLTEEEGEVADQIANDLASAFKLDPGGELPWAEWLELLATIENDPDGFCVTPKDQVLSVTLWRHAGPLPTPAGSGRAGYRLWPVRVQLEGGWSVEVPGELARERNDDHTWDAWDRTRTVWFQALKFTKRDGAPPSAVEAAEVGRKSLPEGEPLPSLIRDGLRGEAVFGSVEEDGKLLWRLSAVVGARGQLAVCNVYVENPADREWAVRTWHSLRHQS